MNYSFKYLVVMRDSKGRFRLARVKAHNAKEAKDIAAETWPKHSVHSVKPSFS